MQQDSRIYVAGHRGMVGSAILRALQKDGYDNLVTRTHDELALDDAVAVREFFKGERIEYVFFAAAKVGGIVANDTYPGDFIRENLLIETNVIDAAYRNGVEKLLFLGSSCIYPKFAQQPISEASLLTGVLEPTNEAYAVAKIAGLTMCNAYRRQFGFDAFTVMPSNVYGIGDNFHPVDSHVIAGLMRRFHDAKLRGLNRVQLWGTGTPLREFTYCDDLAEACILLMNQYSDGGIINVGSDNETSIRDLAKVIAEVVGFAGELTFDTSKPDGTPRKLMDNSKIRKLGWYAQTSLREGLGTMYHWYLATLADV